MVSILVLGHSVAHYRQRKMWEWIAEQGHKVNTVVMPQYRDEKYQMIKKGSFTQNITPVYAPKVGNNYWLFPDLHGLVHTIDPDFIFCVQEPWTFCAYHALMIAKMFQKPFGFFTWENVPKTWPMPWRYMEGQVIKDSDLAVGGNKDACQILLQKDAPHVVQELQTGLDIDLFFPEPKLITEDKIGPRKLLFVGRLTEAKGIKVILQAFDKLPEGKYILRFVGGRGELEPLIRQHPKFGDTIALEPWMEYERLPRVYNWADVSLMPSIDTPMWIEQCGYALGESILCLTSKHLILGSPNKNITKMLIGDDILCNGKLTKIEKTFERRYSGNIFQIKGMGLLPFEVTPEHPIKIANTKTVYYPELRSDGKYPYKKKINKTLWKEAKDIDINDYLMFPKLKETKIQKIVDFSTYYKKITCPSKYINVIPINEETAELFGYYVAEGHASSCGVLSFGKHETKLIERAIYLLRKYLPYKATKYINKTGVQITFGGSVIKRFLHDNFGRGATRKRIPEWILYNEKSILKAFIGAYFKGDGSSSGKGKRRAISFVTTSEELALQLQLALSKFDIFIPISRQKRPEKTNINGREVSQHDTYHITSKRDEIFQLFGLKKKPPRRKIKYHLSDENFFYIPVRKVLMKKYNGTVHNFQTVEREYCVSNIVIHNCHVPAITSASKTILELWGNVPDIQIATMGDVDTLVSLIENDNTYKPAKDSRQAVIEKYSVEKVGQHYIDMIGDCI